MSDGAEKATVRVTIFGEEYAIRTDAPQEYTLECARYVDEAVQQGIEQDAVCAAVGPQH